MHASRQGQEGLDKATGATKNGLGWAADTVTNGWATGSCYMLPNPGFISGSLNVVYGYYRVGSGVVLFTAGTAADVTGIGALFGVPAQGYGVISIVTGSARAYRGIRQFAGAYDDPTVEESPFDYGWDIGGGLLPNLKSPVEFLGGLP
jgi:hypothetical protein